MFENLRDVAQLIQTQHILIGSFSNLYECEVVFVFPSKPENIDGSILVFNISRACFYPWIIVSIPQGLNTFTHCALYTKGYPVNRKYLYR